MPPGWKPAPRGPPHSKGGSGKDVRMSIVDGTKGARRGDDASAWCSPPLASWEIVGFS